MLNSFEQEVTSNKVENKDTIEFKMLAEKMYGLVQKNK